MPGQAAALARKASRSKAPSGEWAMTAFGMPRSRMSVVSARVSTPVTPMIPRAFIQLSSRAVSAKIRRARNVGAHDGADRGRRRGGVDDLDVLVIDADDRRYGGR